MHGPYDYFEPHAHEASRHGSEHLIWRDVAHGYRRPNKKPAPDHISLATLVIALIYTAIVTPIEVAFLSQMIADQLGLDGTIARRCGFLHDIGKAMDHEMEGGHPAIGMEFARKFGEKSEAVLNAIGGHHGDIPATTPYTPIVMAADAVSGARPGARRESMELYVKRLEQLETIAREYPPVREAYAVQAGREVRVIVDAKEANDDATFAIAKNIAKKIEEQMTYPGEIKVTVLREIRAEAAAR